MFYYQILILTALSLAPSLIWLYFYLKQDCHPEPKSLLTKTFLMGIIVSPLAIILELAFVSFISFLDNSRFIFGFTLIVIFWSAIVEEFIKFLAVYLIAIRKPDFDEPIDGMIYMISAGLGFAAIENILYVFGSFPNGINIVLSTLALRFIGATLLHALASGLMGYFLAMSWFFYNHKKKIIITGLIMATLFHASFNLLIYSANESINPSVALVYTTILLIIMAFLVSILFDKIRNRHNHQITQVI
jgi:RsiW-degrading membrane proteinase PrsW (M82 family)